MTFFGILWHQHCHRFIKWKVALSALIGHIVLGILFAFLACTYDSFTTLSRIFSLLTLLATLLLIIGMVLARADFAESVREKVKRFSDSESPLVSQKFLASGPSDQLLRLGTPWLAFPCVGLMALLAFSTHVAVISAPCYLTNQMCSRKALDLQASDRSEPQFGGLAATEPVTLPLRQNLFRLTGGSLYFCVTTMSTVGFGDIQPSVQGYWARFAVALMAFFTMLMIPLIIQAIFAYPAALKAIQDATIAPTPENIGPFPSTS